MNTPDTEWDCPNCQKDVTPFISQIQTQAKKDGQKSLLVNILTDVNKHELEGKGFDFYFVLRTKLDELSNNKEI